MRKTVSNGVFSFIFVTITSLAFGQFDRVRINILDLEAPLDSNRTSTAFIQKAIDECYKQGGGTVVIPDGTFTIGTIVLKSNVCLHLDSGAVLKGSRNIQDYRMPLDQAVRPVMIYANGAKHVRIEGEGVIDGNAEHEYSDLKEVDKFIESETENARLAGVEMKRYYIKKPDVSAVLFTYCEQIELESFSIINSSFWSLHILKSQHVDINNLNIKSSLLKGVNADGIDLNACENVLVQNCTVATGDDGIAIKSWDRLPSQHIRVANCWVSSSSTALKIGTETKGDFKDIVFENCDISNSNRGLSIVVLDGGIVDGVRFSNINIECKRRHFNWWGDGDPIWIYLSKRAAKSKEGVIQNVLFENIQASGMGTSKVESAIDGGIKNLVFQNLRLDMLAEDRPDKRADHAFYISNASDLIFENIDIDWAEERVEPKWGSAVYASDVEGLTVSSISARQGLAKSDAPVVVLENVVGASIAGFRPKDGAKHLVEVRGESARNITIKETDVPIGVKRALIVGKEVLERESIQWIK